MDTNDLLSDVFSTLRIESNFYFQAVFRGAYSVEVPQENRRIRFHLIKEGECWVSIPGEEPVHLRAGDVAIIPNGASQILSAEPDLPPSSLQNIIESGHLKNGLLEFGHGARDTKILCGFYQFDEAVDHPILINLPQIMIIRPAEFGAEPWILATLRLILLETDLNGQGMGGILSRLLEILFIQFIRMMTGNLSAPSNGFMAALSDKHLSLALQAIHKEPEIQWKLGDLAKLSGMSRARFADLFSSRIGVPPITYLTSWRLMKARRLLANSGLDMTDIANRCGYSSMPSFSSRFKKEYDIGPGAYRRMARTL